MAYSQIYQELLSLVTFLGVHSNSEKVSYLSWQNMYPNWKTTCHIKLRFFLYTKPLENLLLAKYLISVPAPLRRKILSLSNLYCLKVKPSFHKKLFQKEKNKLLLWIYARWLSGLLWSNGWQKSAVASLSWKPCSRKLISRSKLS